MQYLGGKSRIARDIVGLIKPRGREVWEPFCGGLSVSVEIAKAEPSSLLVTDVSLPLINLYSALLSGWEPPANVSEAEYAAAKSLPDTNPLKAFIGFGCSFGGKWFGGYARGDGGNYAALAGRVLKRQLTALSHSWIDCVDFNEVAPGPARGLVIYCDPPYAGTEGYKTAPNFCSRTFWSKCAAWARRGAEVFVSEYSAPDFAIPIYERPQALKVAGGGSKSGARIERLYFVQPQ